MAVDFCFFVLLKTSIYNSEISALRYRMFYGDLSVEETASLKVAIKWHHSTEGQHYGSDLLMCGVLGFFSLKKETCILKTMYQVII